MKTIIALVSALVMGCSGDDNALAPCDDAGASDATVHPLPPCATSVDCAPYLAPGPCGALACDPFGLVGEPEVPGVPKGCYVRIDAQCEGSTACESASDCAALRCYTASCANGICAFAPEPAGTACDVGTNCDGAGHCNVIP